VGRVSLIEIATRSQRTIRDPSMTNVVKGGDMLVAGWMVDWLVGWLVGW
jgi:hypothetical protein